MSRSLLLLALLLASVVSPGLAAAATQDTASATALAGKVGYVAAGF